MGGGGEESCDKLGKRGKRERFEGLSARGAGVEVWESAAGSEMGALGAVGGGAVGSNSRLTI